jgi:hypothetical protein
MRASAGQAAAAASALHQDRLSWTSSFRRATDIALVAGDTGSCPAAAGRDVRAPPAITVRATLQIHALVMMFIKNVPALHPPKP